MLCVDKTHQIAVFDGSRLPSDLPQLTLTLTLALALWGSRMGPPMVPVSLEQVRCRFRAPGSAGVIWEVRWRIIIPCFQNRRGRFPRRFHHVGTMEQTGVTDHAVVEQFLITGSRLPISELVIIKLQTNGPSANGGSWNLRAHLDGNSFLGLDIEN